MGQLDAKGLTWRGYMDGMGADPSREAATCGHPRVGAPDNTEAATASDQYATRHDPFMYFHSVIDNQSYCDSHVVNLSALSSDLSSAAGTPNYVFITPNLCNDGHDAKCANGGPGGLAQADAFLQALVPRITSSPAFKQDGLLMILFDEAVGDATACCGEPPGPYDAAHGLQPGLSGPGGGVTGAVLLSPFIKPGTTSSTPYNHYSMLGSVEDIFGLPRLAYAGGTTAFGSDVFTQAAPQVSAVKVKPDSWSRKHPGMKISYVDSAAAVTQLTIMQKRNGYRLAHHGCTPLASRHRRPKHSSACLLTKSLASFTHTDKVGGNTVSFDGRVRGQVLAKGSYLVQLVPKLGSLVGKAKTASFVVTP